MIGNRHPLLPFFASVFSLAFGLNFLWEMLQMSAYAELAGRPWRETAITCAVAGVSDAALTLVIYGIGALVRGSRRWVMRGGWKNYLTAALLAAGCAAAVELAALATGRWSYLSRMPVLPLLGVGLWPFLQLTLWCRSPCGSPCGGPAKETRAPKVRRGESRQFSAVRTFGGRDPDN